MKHFSRPTTGIILAAGLGTRMQSSRPKAMHPIAGKPMLAYLIEHATEVFDQLVIVIGPDMEDVARLAEPFPTVIQTERLGTAHAALQAEAFFGDGDVAILYADNPLISSQTLTRLLYERRQPRVSLALLAMRATHPNRYGRIIECNGSVSRIVEWSDATEEERAINLCNAGVFCADSTDLRRWLYAVENNNTKAEFYLTDVVGLAIAEHALVRAVEAPESELMGINSRAELAAAEAVVQQHLRTKALDAGVTLIAPDTVFFSADTQFSHDVLIEPHVVFGPGVTLCKDVVVRAFSHLEGCLIQSGAIVGPYARIRPESVIGHRSRVGNFVEIKNTHLGDHTKVNHLSYVGDADIGIQSNVGAGTIFCNYDGTFKHHTTLGKDVFIGSNSVLVAPLHIGDNAFVAAGSTVTDDVPAEAMAFGRSRQQNRAGYGKYFKDSCKAKKRK